MCGITKRSMLKNVFTRSPKGDVVISSLAIQHVGDCHGANAPRNDILYLGFDL
jgi:hypothetical protein